MALARTFEGSKDDFLDLLREMASDQTALSRGAGKDEANRRKGVAEGLTMAAEAVRDWKLPKAAKDDAKAGNGTGGAAQPAWSGSPS